ncbi:MAG: hypothetical protein K0R46_416 [Herbinix sp.]|jgi:uncharacterized protein (DUF1919 family)|nr:hypothetical protein [Herbinix sp.]
MKNCILWGTGQDYDKYISYIEQHICKGHLNIVAVTSNDILLSKLDHFDFINKKEIPNTSYDYIIVASDKHFPEIVVEADELGVPQGKVINARVFSLPYFDFCKYISLMEDSVSIISNHCWAGRVYNLLGLKFASPFINLSLTEEDYIKLLMNFDYYMSQSLKFKRDNDVMGCPIGTLDDITISFLHYKSYAQAEECWYRRLARINPDRLFVEMTILGSNNVAEQFDKVPFINKRGFYHSKTSLSSVTCLSDYLNPDVRHKYCYSFSSYILKTVSPNPDSTRPLDLLSLLVDNSIVLRKSYK